MLIKYILFLIALEPNHELNRDPELLARVAGYFTEAAEQYDREPSFVAWQAYKESSIRIDVVGEKKGEIGYAQAHGTSLRLCRKMGYDLATRRGGAFCIAFLLDLNERYCGSFEKGLRRYASGSCYRAKKKMRDRIEKYERQWAKIQSGELTAAIRKKRAMKKALEEQRAERAMEKKKEDVEDNGGDGKVETGG